MSKPFYLNAARNSVDGIFYYNWRLKQDPVFDPALSNYWIQNDAIAPGDPLTTQKSCLIARSKDSKIAVDAISCNEYELSLFQLSILDISNDV